MAFVLDNLMELNWEQVLEILQERRLQYGILASLLGIYVLIKLYGNRKYSLPPGPRAWPLVGNILSLSTMTEINKNFAQWRKQYGDMFTVYLGSKPCVILTTPDIIKEAFITKGHEFNGRMVVKSFELFAEGGKDIVVAQPGPIWKLQRQIAHSAIRKHASAANLERNLDNAMDSFITAVNRHPDKIVEIPGEMLRMTYNFLASVCFGRHFDYDDPWLVNFQGRFIELVDKIGAGLISDFVPALAFLDRTKMKMFESLMGEFNKMFDKELNEHKESFDPNDTRDLTDEILLQLKKQEENSESNPVLAKLETTHLRQILLDMFFAGTDTTRITLSLTIGLIAQYPEVQAKLHKELDTVLGENGRVTLKNKDKLPYTNAVVHESMRLKPVVPVGIPHKTTFDTCLGKYTLPKGTAVMMHTYGVHHDPENFEDPEVFNPKRWIDENGKFIYHAYKFIPFSMGPRVCVGEALARVDLHVFTAMLFYKYEFRPVDDKPFILKTKDIQFGIDAVPYKLKLIERH